ncbi:PCYCGC domain-containing protein [Paraburkholderia fungorum]|uniref:PCYCGC domain-containing protein n=1 Tax=Paraburkholderia fungorum TaxID=134537 RepID=UPI002092A651|nr:PCYCGC domain-containing protein [Paraburkholderia fungorum]USU14659.1 PCYCGC domain-containing protein [Paraburkholderia fungorum]USU22607.1 PCYCGC domain-containing protein [Paraburkholderia fungorum]
MNRHTPEKKAVRSAERVRPSGKSFWHLLFLLALIVAIPLVVVWGPALVRYETASAVKTEGPSGQAQQTSAWRVGMLRPDGLRIIPGGRSDASHVLNPNQFADKDVRHAYWVATQIPASLNKLYCWCGCENRGVHRSNLQCFEDQMAVTCAVCRGTAEIAYQMKQAGVQDAGRVQAAVDAKWAPKG